MRDLRTLIVLILFVSILSFSAVTYKDGKVIFTFKTDIKANVVYLAGNFNNWSPTSWPMKLVDGVWTYEVELKPGSYQYKYVIDGKNWKEDPEAPAFVDDGFGGKNGAFTLTNDGKILGTVSEEKKGGQEKNYELNLQRQNTIFVDPDNYVVIRFYNKDAKYVFIAGSFNNWNDKDTECYYIEDGWWEAVLELSPGIYEYKFVVDGTWVVDPNAFAYTDDGFGGKNGVFELVRQGGKLIVQTPKSATQAVKIESAVEKIEQKVEGEKSITGVGGKIQPGLSVQGRNIIFAVKKTNAQEAYLAGSFNNWNPRALKMNLADGYWVASLTLQPGVYKYKFVFVIGGTDVWEEDPNAPSYEPDGFGGKNGVFKIVEKDGTLIIEGMESQSGTLPVKGAYEFEYKFKTDQTKYFVSSGFSNVLTLSFTLTENTVISLKYNGGTISQALVTLSQANYTIGLHYKSAWPLLSNVSGKDTGIISKLKLVDNVDFLVGIGYENNALPWIIGIDGKNFKLYTSSKYITDSLNFAGELTLNTPFQISIVGMYSLDNTIFTRIVLQMKQFGLTLSTDLSKISGEIFTMINKDILTIGAEYDFSNWGSIYGKYNISNVEYYFDTDLISANFRATIFGKDMDIGLKINTNFSNILGATEFVLFGKVKF